MGAQLEVNIFFINNLSSNKNGEFLRLATLDRTTESFKEHWIELGSNDIESQIEKLKNDNLNCDIFFSPVIFNHKVGKRDSISEISALYADFDDFKGQSLKLMPSDEAENCRLLMVEQLKSLALCPTHIVSTGNGLQAYWLLEAAVNVKGNVEKIEAALDLVARLSQDFEGDKAVAGVGHLLRLPGTYNTKDSKNLKKCEVIWSNPEIAYEFDVICNSLGVERELNKNIKSTAESSGNMFSSYENLNVDFETFKNVALSCVGISFYHQNPKKQSYYSWINLAFNLAVFGEDGRILFHQISEGYQTYKHSETERMFAEASRKIKSGEYFPSNCNKVLDGNLECSQSCKQSTPAGMILSELMKLRRPSSSSNASVSIETAIQNLVPKSTDVENVKMAAEFVQRNLVHLKEPTHVKEAYAKEVLQKLGLPAKGNLSALKKVLSEAETTNFLIEVANNVLQGIQIMFLAGVVYEYANGAWEPFRGNLKRLIIEAIGANYDKRNVEDVEFYIENMIQMDSEMVNNHVSKNMICVNNGMVTLNNLATPKLLPHSPEYYALNKLDIEYDPKAECPMFEQFLKQSFKELSEADFAATVMNLQEFFGYALLPGNEFQKMLFVIGKSRTGKGVILHVLSELLGKYNVSAIPIATIDREFNTINLIDKLANIGPEIGQMERFNVSFVKSLVGEDFVAGRYLHKNLVTFVNRAKLIFASNHLPKIFDASEAMYERALCIPMNSVVPLAERDPALKSKLTAELPGILNWAIEGRRRLFERGYFDESQAMIRLKDSVKLDNNIVLRWILECHSELDRDAKFILLKKCYDSFKDFCAEEGVKTLPRSIFKRNLNVLDAVKVFKPSKPQQDCVIIDWTAFDNLYLNDSESLQPKILDGIEMKPLGEDLKIHAQVNTSKGLDVNLTIIDKAIQMISSNPNVFERS